MTEELPEEVERGMLSHIVAADPEIGQAQSVIDTMRAYEERGGWRLGRFCACGCGMELPKGRPDMKFASERCRMRAAGRRRKGRPEKRVPSGRVSGDLGPADREAMGRMVAAITMKA